MNAFVETLPPRLSESFRCFDRRENSLPARFHQHVEIELTYVPHGDGNRLVGDHIDRYGDHDLVLLGENLPHNWSSDEYRGQTVDMHEAIVLYFQRDFLGPKFLELPEATKLRDLFIVARRGLWFPPEIGKKISERMRHMMCSNGIGRIAELLYCLEILCDCADAIPLASEGFVTCQRTLADSRMTTVLDHINEHFTDWELKASRLAALIDMNNSAFSRRFKGITGHTPTDYINRLRLGFSRRLLLDHSRSVTEVCYASGFCSLSHFSKLFRSRYNVSPSEFRESHQICCDSSAQ